MRSQIPNLKWQNQHIKGILQEIAENLKLIFKSTFKKQFLFGARRGTRTLTS